MYELTGSFFSTAPPSVPLSDWSRYQPAVPPPPARASHPAELGEDGGAELDEGLDGHIDSGNSSWVRATLLSAEANEHELICVNVASLS